MNNKMLIEQIDSKICLLENRSENNPDIQKLDYHIMKMCDDINQNISLYVSDKFHPYWPKWNTLWWKIVFSIESGNINMLEKDTIKKFLDWIDRYYVHFFPLKENEIPVDRVLKRNLLCPCGVGTLIRIGGIYGIDIKHEYNWMYDWFFKYQLPDNGYNCYNNAYTGSGKSSIVTTVSMLEGMLAIYSGTSSEKDILERGFDYLTSHFLYCNSSGKIITEDWLKLTFPRFYDYDILRGFKFLIECSKLLGKKIPSDLSEDIVEKICSIVSEDGSINSKRIICMNENTLNKTETGWEMRENAILFEALDLCLKSGYCWDYLIPEILYCLRAIKDDAF